MTISTKILKCQIDSRLAGGGLTALECCQLQCAANILCCEIVSCVTTSSALPCVVNNVGRLIYVADVCQYYLSDGSYWTNNLSSFPACVTTNVWTWGTNICGVLGDNSVTPRNSPVREVSSSINWCTVDLGVGSNNATVTNLGFVLALKSSGTLWAWGNGACGVLGTNSTICRSSPVQEITCSTWTTIAAGAMQSMAIKSDGSLWGWGGNACGGQLGTNSTIFRSSPVQEVTSSTNWCSVATTFHSSGLKTDGSLWSWGTNACGQLGDNTTTARSSPVREISSSTNWCSHAQANRGTAALKTDGTLWSWGNGLCGNLATGDVLNRSSPVQEVSGSTTWRFMSVGIGGGAAIKTDGSLWIWGVNDIGQLLDSTTTDRSSPIREFTSCTLWCRVSRGQHTAALTTANQMWLWGCNTCGQLGDGTVTNRSSPVREIYSNNNWCLVKVGYPNNSLISQGAVVAIESAFIKGFL